jgi:hypothetical protein
MGISSFWNIWKARFDMRKFELGFTYLKTHKIFSLLNAAMSGSPEENLTGRVQNLAG